MKRRKFLTVLGIAGLGPATLAFATDYSTSDPIQKVGPFTGDRLHVFEFFLFSCFFCQQHHDAIASWGMSIPAPVRFEPVPVVADLESFKAARTFYAVKQAAPDRIYAYLLQAFASARNGATDLASAELLRVSGVPQKAFDQAWRSTAVKSALQRAVELTVRYRITATPSLSVGGRHVLHADQVGGDYGTMMRLANGFVSRVLEGGNA